MANTEITIKKVLVSPGSYHVWESGQITPENSTFTFRDYLDGLDNNMQLLREYSYSYDKLKWDIWREWPRYPFGTNMDLAKPFYLKFKWTLQSNLLGATLIISKVAYSQKCDPVEDVATPTELPFLDQIKMPDIFDIGIKVAANQQAMDYFLNSNQGLDILYWNIKPDKNQIDTILNEYSLQNAKPKMCLKVMVENNVIPTDEVEFDEWTSEYQQFEVQVSKIYFEKIFGKNMKPRDGDFLYLMKANRLYTVFSNRLDRGADQQSTNYILNLKTFEDDTSVKKDTETQAFLDGRTLNHEKYFEEDNVNEMIDTLNTQQNNVATISRDPVREEVDQNIDIKTDPIVWNKGIELITSWYDLSKVSVEDVGVVYHEQISMVTDGEISFASWVKAPINELAVVISSTQNVAGNTEINIKNASKVSIGDYVMDNSNGSTYEIKATTNTTITVAGVVSFATGIKILKYQPVYFIQSDTGAPIQIGFLSNKKVKIKYLTFEQIHSLSFIPADWMSMVVNISNKFKYTGVYFWKMNTVSGNSTHLEALQKSEKENTGIVTFADSQVIIPGTLVSMANIRVYKTAMNYEYQSRMQSSKQVPKASTAYIIDDVREIYNVFNVGSGAELKNNPKKK